MLQQEAAERFVAAAEAAEAAEASEGFVAFAAALQAALAAGCCACFDTLAFPSEKQPAPEEAGEPWFPLPRRRDDWGRPSRRDTWENAFSRGCYVDPAGATAAAAALGAALASPESGPRRVTTGSSTAVAEPSRGDDDAEGYSYMTWTSVQPLPAFLTELLRSLHEQSPLRSLRLDGSGSAFMARHQMRFDTAGLVAALAPGRSRLDTLEICGQDALGSSSAGCASFLAAQRPLSQSARSPVAHSQPVTLLHSSGGAGPSSRLSSRTERLRV